MKKMKARILFALTAALSGLAFAQSPAPAGAPAAKPTMPPVCGSCHKPAPGDIRGYFDNVAFKSNSIQLNFSSAIEIVKFDAKTIKVIDAGEPKKAEHLRDIKKGHEARIEFSEKDGVKTATLISFKGPIKIAQEKLIFYPAVQKLVAAGPEKSSYTLIDSRPLPRFQEGTIPTSINLPFPTFDKFLDRLPKEKDKLLVFFCQGITCMMSPTSLRRAEAMGYTNVKVYREGWPEWTQKNYGVISPAFVKEAFMDKDIPHVMIDTRQTGEAQRTGFIPGAVQLPANKVKAALKTFPDKSLKAPIIVYDGTGKDEAVKAAMAMVRAGYENVVVITGGLAAWQGAGYALATGTPAMKVAYVAKPRPGSLPVEEFRKLAASTPADTLILDVRNQDEANAGMIKGAMLIPDEEILARIGEIPKDKRIVTHCSTGIRAEMAYHRLKEKGYKVAFLNADIDIAKDGKLKITPK
jgi:rhodanese-related sulfurtransferase